MSIGWWETQVAVRPQELLVRQGASVVRKSGEGTRTERA
jgi:hypothetical protein